MFYQKGSDFKKAVSHLIFIDAGRARLYKFFRSPSADSADSPLYMYIDA